MINSTMYSVAFSLMDVERYFLSSSNIQDACTLPILFSFDIKIIFSQKYNGELQQ